MVPLSLFTVFLPNWDWDHDPLPHLICLSHSLSITPSFCFSCALARLFYAGAINSFALLWNSSIRCTADCFNVHRSTSHLSLAKPSSLFICKEGVLFSVPSRQFKMQNAITAAHLICPSLSLHARVPRTLLRNFTNAIKVICGPSQNSLAISSQ